MNYDADCVEFSNQVELHVEKFLNISAGIF